MNYMLSYYCYKSPRVGFVGVADRDFLMRQEIVYDYPEPGMMTCI